MRLRSKLGAVASAVLMLAGMTACSDSGKSDAPASSDSASAKAGDSSSAATDDLTTLSGDEIKDLVAADMKEVTSLRIAGNMGSADGSSMTIDLALDTEGTCNGTMNIGGGVAEVLQVDGQAYLRGDKKFWTVSSGKAQAHQVLKMLGGKWAKLPNGSDSFADFCKLGALLDEFDKTKDTTSTPTVGAVVDIDGQQALELVTRETDSAAITTSWIAVEGKHYILRIQRVGGDSPGTITLSDFNVPVDATAPADGEYVDMGSG